MKKITINSVSHNTILKHLDEIDIDIEKGQLEVEAYLDEEDYTITIEEDELISLRHNLEMLKLTAKELDFLQLFRYESVETITKLFNKQFNRDLTDKNMGKILVYYGFTSESPFLKALKKFKCAVIELPVIAQLNKIYKKIEYLTRR